MKLPFRRGGSKDRRRAAEARRRKSTETRRRREAEVHRRETEEISAARQDERQSFMSSMRGDTEAGAGFGGGMFEELHAAFSGAKEVKLEQREADKARRDSLDASDAPPRDDLDSGVIRIRKPEQDPEQD